MTRALPVALWLAAALISGFTLRRYLEPFDEGLLLQAATRMGDGQWPYADFGWAYGPGQPLAVAAAFKLFGPSVIAWRVLRLIADATIALLVWTLVRREAGPGWALAGWLAAAVTIAQPTSANPVPIALALALGAVTVAVTGDPSPRRAAAAGALAALAGFWRPDFGVVTALAVAAALLARPKGGQTPLGPGGRLAAICGLPPRRANRKGGQTPLGLVVWAMGAAVVGGVVLYVPFAVAAGPGQLWDSLVSRRGAGRGGVAAAVPARVRRDAAGVAAAGAGRGPQGRARVLPAADRGGRAGGRAAGAAAPAHAGGRGPRGARARRARLSALARRRAARPAAARDPVRAAPDRRGERGSRGAGRRSRWR